MAATRHFDHNPSACLQAPLAEPPPPVGTHPHTGDAPPSGIRARCQCIVDHLGHHPAGPLDAPCLPLGAPVSHEKGAYRPALPQTVTRRPGILALPRVQHAISSAETNPKSPFVSKAGENRYGENSNCKPMARYDDSLHSVNFGSAGFCLLKWPSIFSPPSAMCPTWSLPPAHARGVPGGRQGRF